MSSCEGKPRFPLSVERYFTFRALMSESGCILESDSFKTLYRRARAEMRAEVFQINPLDEYRQRDATFQFGYYTQYEIRPGYWYSEWTNIKDYGWLWVSTVSELWHDEDKDTEYHTREKYTY